MPKIYPEEIKIESKKLRAVGYTYTEIQEKLQFSIPKATCNNWFKAIPLSEEAKNRIIDKIKAAGSSGRAIAWSNTKKRRELLLKDTYSRVQKEFKDLDGYTAKLCLAMLYLAEGAKSNECLRFGNSDPRIIQLYLRFFRTSFDVDESKFRCKVQCRADQDTKALEKYWSKITNIPLTQFKKAQIDKRTIGIPTKRADYKGVFVVDYYSNKIFLELKYISDIIYTRLILEGP